MAYEIANQIISGRKAVTAAGTAEPILATNAHCYRVDISADLGNTNPVVVGGSGVVAALGSQEGVVLTPGNPVYTVLTNNVAKIYVDSITNGDAVCFVYYVQ